MLYESCVHSSDNRNHTCERWKLLDTDPRQAVSSVSSLVGWKHFDWCPLDVIRSTQTDSCYQQASKVSYAMHNIQCTKNLKKNTIHKYIHQRHTTCHKHLFWNRCKFLVSYKLHNLWHNIWLTYAKLHFW